MRCALLAVVVALVWTTAASAKTIEVASNGDTGAGTLRDAIASASSGDTIAIPTMTIGLTSGQLAVTKNLTFAGAGARATTISGSNLSRVFDVEGAGVTLSGVTVTGGNGLDHPGGTAGGGGGILLGGGSLTISDSTVTGNNSGTFDDGGIFATGSLTIVRSEISFNASSDPSPFGRGGGVGYQASKASDTLTITDTTFAHNSLTPGGEGAAIYANSLGTGATLTNDTFALNTAGANGSAIDFNGLVKPVSISNTVVLGGAGDDCSRMPAMGASAGHNVEDKSGCEFDKPTDHANAAAVLGPLQNNGGPTATQLPSGSPLIDGGDSASCPATDQRGITRPQGSACDIGAVERTTPAAGSGFGDTLTASGAALHASASTQGLAGAAHFVYGKTASFGSFTADVALPAGTPPDSVSQPVTGLQPGTKYFFALVVSTPDGSVTGPVGSFTTSVSKPPPSQAQCKVPKLKGKSLKKARGALKKAHCALGKVKRPKHAHGKLIVRSQKAKAGSLHVQGFKVSVKLGKKPPKKHHK